MSGHVSDRGLVSERPRFRIPGRRCRPRIKSWGKLNFEPVWGRNMQNRNPLLIFYYLMIKSVGILFHVSDPGKSWVFEWEGKKVPLNQWVWGDQGVGQSGRGLQYPRSHLRHIINRTVCYIKEYTRRVLARWTKVATEVSLSLRWGFRRGQKRPLSHNVLREEVDWDRYVPNRKLG